MKKILYLFISLSVVFLLSSCSSSEETTKTETKTEEPFVFDEPPVDTVEVVNEPVLPTGTYYIVQIGAFTTIDKAEDFAAKSRTRLNKDLVVIYSNDVNLFVVQITTPYTSRSMAEEIRNNLWTMPEYKDAWILTVNR